ncbi:DUF2892 domain-containing protein [Kineococcus sp. R8]|uniref:rhodanese-like domain-containing protein n=1 Tax=Kineococcus siccus TaxID=2696567 RepID=UPI001412D4BE|nr:rhodanese-like domain-containing protein [Kineococcus siccus]NAZ83231.1 DUF2892 domain-containing protein [Kineococcus siccus]
MSTSTSDTSTSDTSTSDTTASGAGRLDRVDAATVTLWLQRADAVTVIDVRSPGEFEAMHIAGSYNVPLELLGEHAASFAARLRHHEEHQVVLVCQSGARATQARRRLAGVGAASLHVLDGGVPSFAAAGGEVVRGTGRWALERQVRLVAGSLVLASTLASLAAPRARFVAGGIGAGLTFSSLFDLCPLGALLSRLPYNRGPGRPDLTSALEQLPHPSGPRGDDVQDPGAPS